MTDSVVYLGRTVDVKGIHPISETVKAIQLAPEQKNAREFKSDVGLLTYYAPFCQIYCNSVGIFV